jgi:SAM-dependent methyltransferase
MTTALALPGFELPEAVDHPARYSAPILARLGELLDAEARALGRPVVALDVFAGVGGIHRLARSNVSTVGLELEMEWCAGSAGPTINGDATRLPIRSETVDVVATSPCYGNRMADHHEARDSSRRITYRHMLGRPLSPGSAAAMQWGDDYRALHLAAWAEALRVLRPGGLLLCNVKDHTRKGVVMPVVLWHRSALDGLGFAIEAVEAVSTRGMRLGANREARADGEAIIRARKEGSTNERTD